MGWKAILLLWAHIARSIRVANWIFASGHEDRFVRVAVVTGKDLPGQRRLGHLKDRIAAMAHQPGAGLDQSFAKAGLRI